MEEPPPLGSRSSMETGELLRAAVQRAGKIRTDLAQLRVSWVAACFNSLLFCLPPDALRLMCKFLLLLNSHRKKPSWQPQRGTHKAAWPPHPADTPAARPCT